MNGRQSKGREMKGEGEWGNGKCDIKSGEMGNGWRIIEI